MVIALAGASGGRANIGGGVSVQGDYKGFDRCALPSTSQMNTWWNSSPYFEYGFYGGGVNVGCTVTVSTSWLNTVSVQGWEFLPIWVSYQAQYGTGSCQTTRQYNAYISLTPSTAHTQGVNAAISAESAMNSLGLTTGTVIYDDVEGYDTSNSTCVNAVNSFVDGWDQQLQADGYVAGMYGSSSASGVQGWASLAHVPNDVYAADWNNTATVWNLSGLGNSYWVGDRRIHQYQNLPSGETWGGVTLKPTDRVCDLGQDASLAPTSEDAGENTNESNGPTEDASC
jgi:Domain of unknown function (DUF1906)